ncbi:MAG TPA: hypothetical protein VGR63_12020 [Casimicrobiaceae bacterium]|nr:hypothetical protein [Casimicrobiaceae bacterium]
MLHPVAVARSPNAVCGAFPKEHRMQAPAEDPFAWSKLVKEWLAWGAAAVVLAVAFHEAYRLLGLYA